MDGAQLQTTHSSFCRDFLHGLCAFFLCRKKVLVLKSCQTCSSDPFLCSNHGDLHTCNYPGLSAKPHSIAPALCSGGKTCILKLFCRHRCPEFTWILEKVSKASFFLSNALRIPCAPSSPPVCTHGQAESRGRILLWLWGAKQGPLRGYQRSWGFSCRQETMLKASNSW